MQRAAILACATFLFVPSARPQTPPRPQISGIAFVRIKASDFQRSSETYGKILGLRTGSNGCINVKNPCFVVNASQHIELTQAQPGDPGSWLDEVAFETSSVREMRDYLRSQRVSVSQIENTPHGIPFIETKDPEGNRIAFVQSFSEISVARVPPNQVSSRLFHAGFVVKNLAMMKHFYMDTLGFRLYWKGGFKDLPPGTPEKDSDIDWFEIQVPDG